MLPPNYNDSTLRNLCFYLPLDVLPRWFVDLFVNGRQPMSPGRPTLDQNLAKNAATDLFSTIFDGHPTAVSKNLKLKFAYRTSFYWERWHSVQVRLKPAAASDDPECYSIDVDEGMQPLFESQN